MEPIEYFRLMRRRWRVLVACVLVAIVAAWVTSPSSDSDQPVEFTATATIIRDTTSSVSQPAPTVALFMRTGDVPARVAERLGFDGNPLLLARDIDAEIDDLVSTIDVVATATSRQDAADLANAFVEETLAFLAEQAQDAQQAEVDLIIGRVTQLRAEIEALEGQIAELEAAEASSSLVEAERDAKLGQYGIALDQQQQALDQPLPTAGYNVLVDAESDLARIKRDGFDAPRSRPVRAGLGALLGLLLGVGAVLVLERLDTRIHTRANAEEAFHLPVVAEVPADDRTGSDHSVLSAIQPGSAVAEGYRQLRAALLLMPTRQLRDDQTGASEPHVVLVTSPAPGDGKTVSVANLAAAFAETGRTVLVLGCDFRRPEIQNYLGVADGEGIGEVLQAAGGHPALPDVIRPTTLDNVRLATSGRPLRNFGDVAAAGRRLVTAARGWADIVLIDTAPLLATTDATELIPAVDAVVLVCRSGRTTTGAARRCRDLLERLNAPVTGVALIGAAAEERSYSSYYYAEQSASKRQRRGHDQPSEVGPTSTNGDATHPLPYAKTRRRDRARR